MGDRISSLNPRPEANPLQKVVFPEPKSPLSRITEPYSIEFERFYQNQTYDEMKLI